MPNTILLTLLRDPQERALAIYNRVALKLVPHAYAQGTGAGLRVDDDTSSAHHSRILEHFVSQDAKLLSKYPQLRYTNQWESFGNSVDEAIKSISERGFIIGLYDRIEEFIVLTKSAIGWRDLRF